MIEIVRATVFDAKEMTELIQYVHSCMDNKEWYVIDDLDYYTHYLKDGYGITYKAIDIETNQMVGIFMAIIPDTKEVNLGYDLGLDEKESKKVAVMETAAVLPEYRGNNLKYRLMQAAEAELIELGYCYLTGTVHPENRFSLNVFLKQGYHIAVTKEKYQGLLRDVLMKEIKKE